MTSLDWRVVLLTQDGCEIFKLIGHESPVFGKAVCSSTDVLIELAEPSRNFFSEISTFPSDDILKVFKLRFP